jgi:hypothetical protein
MKENSVRRSVRIKGLFFGYFLILFLLTAAVSYVGFQWMADRLSVASGSPDALNTVDSIRFFMDLLKGKLIYWAAPSFAIFLMIWASLLYQSVQKRLTESFPQASPKSDVQSQSLQKPPGVDREFQENHDRRMFLHLLGLFQREGRLVDFFHENLDSYDDAQIGAAVRSIHENCQKVMERFVKTQPVLEQEEGDSISLSKGFDTNMIKLIGNVAGEPPFHGVIRHRGWKARKKDIPELSGNLDSTLIVPAEVEIS